MKMKVNTLQNRPVSSCIFEGGGGVRLGEDFYGTYQY